MEILRCVAKHDFATDVDSFIGDSVTIYISMLEKYSDVTAINISVYPYSEDKIAIDRELSGDIDFLRVIHFFYSKKLRKLGSSHPIRVHLSFDVLL